MLPDLSPLRASTNNENYEHLKNEWLRKLDKNTQLLETAPDDIKNDRNFLLDAVNMKGSLLLYVPQKFLKDRELVLAAVTKFGMALAWAHKDLQSDKDIVLAAIKSNPYALTKASDVLQSSKEFVMLAVEANPKAIEHTLDQFKQDKEVVLTAFRRDYYDPLWNNNHDIMHYIVGERPEMLKSASRSVKEDRKVVLKALTVSGWALAYASSALQNDPQLIMTAIKTNGTHLRPSNEYEMKIYPTMITTLSNIIMTYFKSKDFITLQSKEQDEYCNGVENLDVLLKNLSIQFNNLSPNLQTNNSKDLLHTMHDNLHRIKSNPCVAKEYGWVPSGR